MIKNSFIHSLIINSFYSVFIHSVIKPPQFCMNGLWSVVGEHYHPTLISVLSTRLKLTQDLEMSMWCIAAHTLFLSLWTAWGWTTTMTTHLVLAAHTSCRESGWKAGTLATSLGHPVVAMTSRTSSSKSLSLSVTSTTGSFSKRPKMGNLASVTSEPLDDSSSGFRGGQCSPISGKGLFLRL